MRDSVVFLMHIPKLMYAHCAAVYHFILIAVVPDRFAGVQSLQETNAVTIPKCRRDPYNLLARPTEWMTLAAAAQTASLLSSPH